MRPSFSLEIKKLDPKSKQDIQERPYRLSFGAGEDSIRVKGRDFVYRLPVMLCA